MIFRLTWRNLWRNRRRTFITMASVTFAFLFAVLMQSFQKGAFDNLVKNIVNYYYGYIQLHKSGYWDEKVLDNGFPLSDSLQDKLQKQNQVTAMVPRIETFTLASVGNTTKGCLLIGTDLEKENRLTGLLDKIVQGSPWKDEESAALLAEGLAKRLNISLNDTLIVLGQGYHGTMAAGKFPVKGFVHFGSPELNDQVVYVPLPVAQRLLSAGNIVTSIAFSIENPDRMEEVQQDLAGIAGPDYEIMNWNEMMPEIENYIKADTAGLYIFNGILYLVIAFGIFGTVLMMTTERHYEFGMLISIGMKKINLGLILLTETVIITILGILTGVLFSFPLIILFEKKPIRLTGDAAEIYERFGFEALLPTTLHVPFFFAQGAVVLAIAVIISIYPLWYIKNLDPVAAMKK